jgi:CBS domain-containing protein
MPQAVRDVMTPAPVALAASTPLVDAAKQMKQHDIGDVLVTTDGSLCGIVTDRDIVVRGLAEGRDPTSTSIDEICSHDLVSVSPDDSVSDAAEMMRHNAVRRLPVVEAGQAVGMVSIGDLAIEVDADSALADISSAPPNH